MLEQALQEAADFEQAYEKDVQFIFSHVQHHWHELNEKRQASYNEILQAERSQVRNKMLHERLS